MKRKKNIVYRKSISLLAAAAMTAVLMTGQIYPVTAESQNIESGIRTSTIIPDNITIDEPVALSEITLPKSDYGTLSWADDTYVPTKRVQSCKVVFKPAKDLDLSYLTGWDSEDKVVKGKITVVVTSLTGEESEGSEEEAPSDDSLSEEPAEDTGKDTQADSTADSATGDEDLADSTGDTAADTENSAGAGEENENSDAESEENVSATGTPETDESAADKEETAEKAPSESAILDTGASAGAGNTASEEPSASEENSAESASANASEEKTEAGDAGTADISSAVSENESNSEDAVTDEKDGTEQTDKINEALTDVMPGATVFDEKEETPSEDQQKNIFDNPLDFTVADARPNVVAEDLTEEEQAAIAVENHSCEGISVSGVDLPWYVQFQVTSGENYEFKNENKAAIFQSYEFKLWDLKNNTEYEIPDGQYISVTIPVKEGYSYSIEHLLDNGATETIVPSVNGSTMVFSTHSFSPFGIAGFRPIVGEEIADNAYGATATPTPTPTATVSGTPTPSPTVTGTAGNKGNGSTGNSGSSTAGNTGNNGSGSTTGGDDTGNVGSSGNGSTASGTGTSGSSTTGSNIFGGSTSGSGTSSGSVTDNSGSTSTGQNQSGAASTSGNSGQNQTSNAVKTGDNTVILPFVILVFAAVIVIIVILVVRKKKNK